MKNRDSVRYQIEAERMLDIALDEGPFNSVNHFCKCLRATCNDFCDGDDFDPDILYGKAWYLASSYEIPIKKRNNKSGGFIIQQVRSIFGNKIEVTESPVVSAFRSKVRWRAHATLSFAS